MSAQKQFNYFAYVEVDFGNTGQWSWGYIKSWGCEIHCLYVFKIGDPEKCERILRKDKI